MQYINTIGEKVRVLNSWGEWTTYQYIHYAGCGDIYKIPTAEFKKRFRREEP